MFGSEKPLMPVDQLKKALMPVEPSKKAADVSLSTIAKGLEVSGEIKGQGDVCIEGSFKGDVACNKLIVGNHGDVDGRIHVEEFIVHGTFTGEAISKSVRLMSTAVVNGDVFHDILEVAAGAKVDGRYSRNMSQHNDIAAEEATQTAEKKPISLKTVEGGKEP